MASDDYDLDMDWGDDPFGGDIDFDMDFNMDPYAKKGFFRSLGSGFLAGLTDETVGTGEARFRTLRTILPGSFSNALDRASFISDRISELKDEFKEENAQSAKSLQNIAGQLGQRMDGKLPGFVKNGLTNFSEKDFSSWERLEGRSENFNTRLDSTSEEDVSNAIDHASQSQAGMFSSLGESLNAMTAVATSALQSAIGTGNRQLVNIEGAMRDMLDYHRNFEAKIHQAQMSIAARSYVQDAKFYKFMEAGIHAEVAELKKIAKASAMSDFQKTTTYTASKEYVRNKLFSTVGNRIGGLTGALRDKFGSSTRKEAYSVFGNLIDSVSDGMDMAGDGGLSRGMIGDILGKMAAGTAIDKIPAFFTRGPGKKAIDRLTQLYPEQADYINGQIKKLTEVGNVVSYISTGGGGLLNYAAQNYTAMDEMKFADYEEYLDSLPPGKKPLSKTLWTALNASTNKAKQTINKMMSEVTQARGTQYTIKKRDVKDLNQPGIWKEMNNITLNEVLPGLLSRNNQILEQIRTGKDEVESVSFNYMRGQFQTDTQKKLSTQADLMPHSEFQRYAEAALTLVDGVDPGKLMSESTRKALALIVAKDIDAEMGFNPYYYLGDIKGMSAESQKEVHAALMTHFGITTTEVDKYKKSDTFERMKMMTNMPTTEGREHLNSVSASAVNMKQNFPNIAERIDLLRSTGNEQLLRDMGVIYTADGIDKINMQAFHDRIGMYMDDPNNPALRGVGPGPAPKDPTVGGLGGGAGGNPGNGGNGLGGGADNGPTVNPYDGINETLKTLNERLANLKFPDPKDPGSASPLANFDVATGELTDIKESNRGILATLTNVDTLMKGLLDLANSGKLMTGKPDKPSDEAAEERSKNTLFKKLKDLPLGRLLGTGAKHLMSRNPIVMGGILGLAGSQFLQNPLAAAAVAGGGLLAGALYDKYLRRTSGSGSDAHPTGDEPSDEEDIYGSDGEIILKAIKLRAGEYFDAATKRVIKTWNDIRGPVYDAVSKVVIGVRDLAGKIFGADGRALALRGLRHVRDAAVGAYNFLDPINRIKALVGSGRELIYQQDVYLKSDTKNPVLRAGKFKTNEYFIRDESGNFKPIAGWNEINGPVYDHEGNQLVSQDEYAAGLVTSSGAVVRNLGNGVSNLLGGAVGLGRAGVDKLLGRFGFSREGAGSGNATDPGAINGNKTNGIEQRLDKIYRLLAEHFKHPLDLDPETGDPISESGKPNSTGGPDVDGLRLNSLAWKKKKSEEDERHKVNEAIIQIAENTEALGEADGKNEEKGGIFAKLKSFIGGIGAFGMNLIKNPIGTIGSTIFGSLVNSTARLAKIGTALFSGVLGLASPMYKLMKWGFSKVAMAMGVKRALGDLGDADAGDIDQHGQSGRRRDRRRSGRRGFRGRGIAGALLTAGSMYAGGKLANSIADYDEGQDGDQLATPLAEMKTGDRDPATGRYKTWSDTAMEAVTSWLPQGQLADGLVNGALGKETGKKLDDYGLFWSSDGKFFINRQERDAQEDKINGVVSATGDYGTVKANTNITQQKRVRFAMYGIRDINSPLARRVMGLEASLYQYVVIRNDRASLKPDTPIDQIMETFAKGGSMGQPDQSAVKAWFLGRFKPIFMVYNAAVSVARMGDIVEFDNAKKYDVVQVVERVQQSIASLNPYPYNIDTRIDETEAIMSPEQSREIVSEYIAELKKQIPAPPTAVETIARTTETAKAEGDTSGQPGTTPTPEMTAQGKLGAAAARASSEAANKAFTQPADVKTINIDDLMPGAGKEMDAFTMVRLAVYGNIDNMPWRVEAVLRLERYLENFIMVMGNDARFTGKSNQVLELFKASFRINSDQAANNWMIWFRDRFLPTMMTYVKEVHRLRGTEPARGWKQLSATNRAVIARLLTGQIVTTADSQKPVWEIEASPFPGAKSGIWSDRADKYLEILDAKAQEARLKDPELEAVKSAASTKPQTPNGTNTNLQQKTQNIMDQVYRTGAVNRNNVGMAGAMGGAPSGGYMPNATMSAPGGGAGSAGAFMGQANANFNPEFIKQAGEDKGIKMSLEQGEQLMLNHLVKAGFRDNKTLALALAMAKKETGGYQATVENTNWSAPTLMKYFKNIPDQATAQKVASMSPAERAMWVYGRNPKAKQLGNQKEEDGWLYRGRGLFQLTGRANYEAFKKATGIDVVSNPRLVSEDPNVMAESAVWYLKNNKAMQSIAQTGDFDTAVRGINGGNAVPATDERRQFYNDYLNRLRSGDLNLPGTEDAPENAGGGMSNDPMVAQVPESADKNVPADKVVKPEDAPVKPGGPASVKELLAQGNASNVPSNAGNSNTASATNASPLSTPAVPSTSTSESSGGGSSSAPSASSSAPAPVSAPVVSTPTNTKPAPTVSPASSAPAAAPASVNLPDQMSTYDQVAAKLLEASNTTLVAILKTLQAKQSSGSKIVDL